MGQINSKHGKITKWVTTKIHQTGSMLIQNRCNKQEKAIKPNSQHHLCDSECERRDKGRISLRWRHLSTLLPEFCRSFLLLRASAPFGDERGESFWCSFCRKMLLWVLVREMIDFERKWDWLNWEGEIVGRSAWGGAGGLTLFLWWA